MYPLRRSVSQSESASTRHGSKNLDAAQPLHSEDERPAAPRFSVIVPVFQTVAWVRECLDSIIQQSFQNFDVLVIDDGSTDGSGDVIDQYAQKDRRIRTFHHPRNLGLGRARNLGLEHATADYILFVDSDDVVPQHAFKSIDGRLKEARNPELLMYDFARLDHHGQLEPYGFTKKTLRDMRDVFDAAQVPDILYTPWSSWNKAYSRELIARHRFRFPTGHYEDLLWSCMALLLARTIALHHSVCLHFRIDRPGSITNTRDDRQLEIFDRYEKIFAFIQELPDPMRWQARAKVLEVSLKALQYQKGRIPSSLLPEFDRRCVDHFSGHPQMLAQVRDAIAS